MDSYRDNKGRFIKGYNPLDIPLEIRIKKSHANSMSWKNRKDYIMDLVNENPYIYNSWRSIRFTEKGKRAGNDERWNNFRNFYEDVSTTYKKGLVLRRKNRDEKWSKDNFIWIRKEDEYLLDKNAVRISFNGENLTLKEWSNKAQVSYSAIKNRYYKREKYHYTDEEIIYGRKRKRGTKIAKDYNDDGIDIRAKASKMISSYKFKDKKNNVSGICDITIEWMIENIFKKKCAYCGDTKRLGCDRIDNSKGHTMDNVVPCCIECNAARNNNFSYEEMLVIGKAIRKVKEARKINNR